MIKLVKNDFFIYCKEARIESHRSFYGSFCLGPFEAGQSITIANALRRTLLSELKGLAITSAEIEGAFHEYSTLPGVKDSILDILLNFKDIVLKGIHFGNKQKGTSSAATFKTEQVGYLKTRGPGVVTASELKLPPGIQCVDPDQYIATLSEEGVLNVKFNINEGKNYVIQTYKNSFANSYNYHINKGEQQLINAKANAENLFLNFPTLPTFHNQNSLSISLVPNSNIKNIQKEIYTKSSLLTLVKQPFYEHKKRRLWLNKIRLRYNLDSLKFSLKVNQDVFNRKTPIELPATLLLADSKENNFLIEGSPQKKLRFARIQNSWINRGLVLNKNVSKVISNRELLKDNGENTLQNDPLLRQLISSQGPIKQKGFAQQGQSALKSSFKIDLKHKQDCFLHSGGAIAASKAVSLAIDAVFMPVNKVNYIIEINEQSVMAKEKNSANTTSLLTPLYNIGEIFHHHPLYRKKTLSHFVQKKQSFQSSERNQSKATGVQTNQTKGSSVKKKPLFSLEIQNNVLNPPPTQKIYSIHPLKTSFHRGNWFTKKRTVQRNNFISSKHNNWLFQVQKTNSWKSYTFKLKMLFSAPFFSYRLSTFEANPMTYRFIVPFLSRLQSLMGGERLVWTKKKTLFFSDHKNKPLNTKKYNFIRDFTQKNLSLEKKKLKKITRIYKKFLTTGVPLFPCRLNIKQSPFKSLHVDSTFLDGPWNNQIGFFNISKHISLNSATVLNANLQHSSSIFSSRFFAVNKTTVGGSLLSTQIWPSSPAYFFNSPKKIKLGLQERNDTGGIPRNRRPHNFKIKDIRKRDHICLSTNQTSTALKNNINIEIWTNGSIHPRQALYEACKNLLSLFSKLEKATPLAVEKYSPLLPSEGESFNK